MSDTTQPTKVKTPQEAWERLKYLKSFWLLLALFGLIPVVRILGI